MTAENDSGGEKGPVDPETNRMNTDEQLLELAKDIRAGLVYGTWDERVMAVALSVFMPLAFMTDGQWENMKTMGVAQIYGLPKDRLGNMGINGIPVHSAIGMLSHADCKRLSEIVQTLEAAEEKAKQAVLGSVEEP